MCRSLLLAFSLKQSYYKYMKFSPRACLLHTQDINCMIPIAAHSDIRLSPMLDHSNIGLKRNQSEIISDIGLTFLAVSAI
jgi:hypothetical protein